MTQSSSSAGQSSPGSDLIAAFREHISDAVFPCVGAKAAMARDQLEILCCGDLTNDAGDGRLHQALVATAQGFMPGERQFCSFAALFTTPLDQGEAAFEAAVWRRLQALADRDAAAGFAYDPDASPDPADPRFALSFGGKAFFVVALHPGASRPARRFRQPALVFNLHAQFDTLRAAGLYEGMRAKILQRDVVLAGSINPMLARFGESSEARQYSGRAVNDHWECPFHHRGAA